MGRGYLFIEFVPGVVFFRQGLSWVGFVRYGFVWGGVIVLLGLSGMGLSVYPTKAGVSMMNLYTQHTPALEKFSTFQYIEIL